MFERNERQNYYLSNAVAYCHEYLPNVTTNQYQHTSCLFVTVSEQKRHLHFQNETILDRMKRLMKAIDDDFALIYSTLP
jgi:hypothetical protein